MVFHRTETGVAVFTGISGVVAGGTIVGAVIVKFALLIVSTCDLLAPAPVTVSVSVPTVPALVAVTAAVICPVESAIPVEGVKTMGLPFCEVTASVAPGTATPDESFTIIVRVLSAACAMDVLPLIVIFVPVTVTVPLATAVPAVAETVITRFVMSVPIFSVAVASPLASDTGFNLVK